MKPTIFLLGALLIFSTCKRDDGLTEVTTKVHGHLMVLGTEEVINDRPYKMVLKDFYSSKIFDQTYTDENGRYEFIRDSYLKNNEPNEVYEILLDDNLPDETFTGGMPLFLDTLSEFASFNKQSPGYIGRGVFIAGFQSWANVNLEKKAWLELHVENIDPEIGDYIRIHFVSHRGTPSVWRYEFHHGQNFKVILPGVGNVKNILQYTVRIDNEYVGKSEQIKLGEMDTTYFKLEY